MIYKSKLVFSIGMLALILISCNTYKSQKKKMNGTWIGNAGIILDSNYIPESRFFPFSDSLMAFYNSFNGDNYIQIDLNDSFAVVNALSFYKNRVFTIDWTALKAGDDYIVLYAPTTREDVEFRDLLRNKNIQPGDSNTADNVCLEMFDMTKDREIIFLKNIEIKKDSMFCDVESDMIVAVKQKLRLKKYIEKSKNN